MNEQELRDRLREAVRLMAALEQACDELMTEFISKKRAANWKIINDAMYDSARFRYQANVEELAK